MDAVPLCIGGAGGAVGFGGLATGKVFVAPLWEVHRMNTTGLLTSNPIEGRGIAVAVVHGQHDRSFS